MVLDEMWAVREKNGHDGELYTRNQFNEVTIYLEWRRERTDCRRGDSAFLFGTSSV